MAYSIQSCSAYLTIPCERLQQRYRRNHWESSQSRCWVWSLVFIACMGQKGIPNNLTRCSQNSEKDHSCQNHLTEAYIYLYCPYCILYNNTSRPIYVAGIRNREVSILGRVPLYSGKQELNWDHNNVSALARWPLSGGVH